MDTDDYNSIQNDEIIDVGLRDKDYVKYVKSLIFFLINAELHQEQEIIPQIKQWFSIKYLIYDQIYQINIINEYALFVSIIQGNV